MPVDQHEKLYGILLDVQKQIGTVNSETSRQSQMLIDLNAKVAIANGRTGKNEAAISMLKEWRKYILGGFFVITTLGVYLINSFKNDIIQETSKNVLTILEDKYDPQIK